MPVRKREDRGSWQVDVRIDGRRIREDYPTKRKAVLREREILAQAAAGTLVVDVNDIPFVDFVPIYLNYAEAVKAPKTAQDETWLINAHFVEAFATTPLSRITPATLERYKIKRVGDGVSPRTINYELQILSVMFKLAMRLGHARLNPVREVERLSEDRRPPRYLTTDEVSRLLEAARDHYLYPLIVCALHTGMRKSELFHLQWSDVDFDSNVITIQSKTDWKTKNRRYRTVEMTAVLQDVLRANHDVRLPAVDNVFTYDGRPLAWTVKRSLATLSRRAGIERVSLHVLRHTFASHLAMQGVPLMHIQQLLGHSDYATTLIYAHISHESHKGQVHNLPFGARNPSKES